MSETSQTSVSSTLCDHQRSEEPMLREDMVQEILARIARGEGIKRLPASSG
jgi:hypothetical protein